MWSHLVFNSSFRPRLTGSHLDLFSFVGFFHSRRASAVLKWKFIFLPFFQNIFQKTPLVTSESTATQTRRWAPQMEISVMFCTVTSRPVFFARLQRDAHVLVYLHQLTGFDVFDLVPLTRSDIVRERAVSPINAQKCYVWSMLWCLVSDRPDITFWLAAVVMIHTTFLEAVYPFDLALS